MPLSRRSFEVLNRIRECSGCGQREIAEKTGLSLGTVNAAVRDLAKQGLIDGAEITDAGFEALHPYKVDNAIILAAGLSSRFAPISYEKSQRSLAG